MELKDAVAIITGASRGIGRAIAEALSREGAKLILNARGGDALDKAASDLDGIPVPGDAGDEATADALVKAALEKHGRIDIVVNNAGIMTHGAIDEMEPAAWDALIRTNLRGPYLLTRAVLPVLKKQKSGTIVNMASLAGHNPVPNMAAYAASKWGLLGFSRSVMLEVRQHNIRVMMISPGSTLTDPAKTKKDPARIAHAEDVASVLVAALKVPERANISEFEIRPTNP